MSDRKSAIVTGSTSGIGLVMARARANQPIRPFAEVAQVGALAVFLASDVAAQITGAALPVDAGWRAR